MCYFCYYFVTQILASNKNYAYLCSKIFKKCSDG